MDLRVVNDTIRGFRIVDFWAIHRSEAPGCGAVM